MKQKEPVNKSIAMLVRVTPEMMEDIQDAMHKLRTYNRNEIVRLALTEYLAKLLKKA